MEKNTALEILKNLKQQMDDRGEIDYAEALSIVIQACEDIRIKED